LQILGEKLKAPVTHLLDYAVSGVVVEWREVTDVNEVTKTEPVTRAAPEPQLPPALSPGGKPSAEPPQETSRADYFAWKPGDVEIVEPTLAHAPVEPKVKTKRNALFPVENVTVFVNDDIAYRAWIEAHPGGYVVNTDINSARMPNPEYVALHRATCRFISNFDARETGAFTARGFIKVCADETAPLSKWTTAHGRADGSFTGKCRCLSL